MCNERWIEAIGSCSSGRFAALRFFMAHSKGFIDNGVLIAARSTTPMRESDSGFGTAVGGWQQESSGRPNRPELQTVTAALVLSPSLTDVKLISNHFDLHRAS